MLSLPRVGLAVVALFGLLTVAPSCSSEVDATNPNPTPTAGDGKQEEPTPSSATWLPHSTLRDKTATIDIPAAPSGRTTLVMVPGTSSLDWRTNNRDVDVKTEATLHVDALVGAPRIPGEPLPP